MMIELGINPAKLVSVLNYDGTPITADNIFRKIRGKLGVVSGRTRPNEMLHGRVFEPTGNGLLYHYCDGNSFSAICHTRTLVSG